jgi:predicted nucleic acid-binding protein
MQTLVDASVWIDYFTGKASPETDHLDSLIGRSPLLVADVTMEEVLYGLLDETHRRQAWAALTKFWLIEVRGIDLARRSAVHYQTLRARGIEVRPAKCRLATLCIAEDFRLLHSSPGYAPFERFLGLTVARP